MISAFHTTSGVYLKPMTSAQTHTQSQGITALVSAGFVYAGIGILSKFVGYDLPLFYQNWTREVVAVVLLLWAIRFWKPVAPQHRPWLFFRGVAAIVSFLTFFVAINAMPINITYFVFYAGSTIGGFFLGNKLFGEKMTAIRWSSLGLSFFGLSLVYGVSIETQNPVFLLSSFISGISASFWNISSKKIVGYHAAQMSFIDGMIQLIVYFAISVVLREPWPLTQVSLTQGASLAIGACFVITGLLMVYGFRRLDAQIGSLLLLSEALFVIVMGNFFFHEVPSVMAIIGGSVIIVSMILPEVNWKTIQKQIYDH